MAKVKYTSSTSSGKTYIDMKLLLKGAARLEEYLTDTQVDSKTNKQKYIGQLESYLTSSGNIHQDVSDTSCFKLDLSSLNSLNEKFKKINVDLEKLIKAVRDTANQGIKNEFDDAKKATETILKSQGDFVSVDRINYFFDHLTDKEKKTLAALLMSATGAQICISSDLLSVLSESKKGKEFEKKYLKAYSKTTKKAISKTKVKEYAPAKYKRLYGKNARDEWQKDLQEDLQKKYGLSKADAKALAKEKMDIIAKRNIEKAKVEVNKKLSAKQQQTKIDKLNKEYDAAIEKLEKKAADTAAKYPENKSKSSLIADEKKVNTSDNSVIEAQNEAGKKPDPTPEQPAEDTPVTPEPEPTPETEVTPEPVQPTENTTTTTETVVDDGGNTYVEEVQEGPVSNQGEQLPPENPKQDSSNFQEAVDEQRELNPVDETVAEDPNVGMDVSGDEISDVTDSDLVDTDISDTGDTHTTVTPDVEKSTSTTTTTHKKSSGSASGVVPAVAGVATAGAAGVGAKIILDRRTDSVSDANFGTENWSDGDNDDYGLTGDTSSEYVESTGYQANKSDLIEDDSDSHYDYKAESINEIDLDEKEKADEEAGKISFHDNIAFDAINEAEMSG